MRDSRRGRWHRRRAERLARIRCMLWLGPPHLYLKVTVIAGHEGVPDLQCCLRWCEASDLNGYGPKSQESLLIYLEVRRSEAEDTCPGAEIDGNALLWSQRSKVRAGRCARVRGAACNEHAHAKREG